MHTPRPSPVSAVGYSIREGSAEFDDVGLALDEAESLGADVVELPLYAWHLIVGGRVLRERLADLRRALAGRSFGYTVHGPLAVNLMDLPERLPRHEAVLNASIEIASEIGAPHLVMHSGLVRSPGDDIEIAYGRQRDALARAGDRAEALGVTLCVENVFGAGVRETASPSRLAGELDVVSHAAVRATLDISHAYLRCAEIRLDPIAEIAALAPFAAHLHLHDSFGRPKALWTYDPAEEVALGEGDLHLPVGWGAIDWEAVTDLCRVPDGAIAILELNPRHWRELASQIATVRSLAARFQGQILPSF